jgi:hypothetical protein
VRTVKDEIIMLPVFVYGWRPLKKLRGLDGLMKAW